MHRATRILTYFYSQISTLCLKHKSHSSVFAAPFWGVLEAKMKEFRSDESGVYVEAQAQQLRQILAKYISSISVKAVIPRATRIRITNIDPILVCS